MVALLKAAKTLHEEYVLSTIGVVLDMGEQAYARTKTDSLLGRGVKQGDLCNVSS